MFLSVLFFSCAASHQLKQSPEVFIKKGVWHYSPVTVDGNDSEWTVPLFFSDDKYHLTYSITNDEDYVYMVLKTGDIATQAKILYNGVSLGMSGATAKKNTLFIQYPVPRKDYGNGKAGHYTTNSRATNSNTDIYEIKGSSSGNGLHFRNQRDGRIHVQLGFNKRKEMVYEVQVPFSLFKSPFRKNKNEQLNCRIAISGFERKSELFNSVVQKFGLHHNHHDVDGYEAGVKINKSVNIAVRNGNQ